MAPQNSSISEQKKKLITQLIVGLSIVFIMGNVMYKTVINFSQDPLLSNGLPIITYIIIGIIGLIIISYIINLIRDFLRLNMLLPVLENIASSYGFKFESEINEMKRIIYKPFLGVLHGEFHNKGITIFPALDYTRKQNKQPMKITIFDTVVNNSWPSFSLNKKTALSSFFSKLLGGIEYRGKFIVQFQPNPSKSKELQLSELQNVLMESVLYDYENLPGKNTIIVQNGIFSIIHDKFIYKPDEYPIFMNMLSKVL